MSEIQKIAVITGASKGIGKAIAIGLAELNYKTILLGRNLKDLENVAGEIEKQSGSKPKILSFDITNTKELKNSINRLITEFENIDVLVNNAGVFFEGTLDLSEDNFRTMLDTNLTAQFTILQQIVPVMKQQKSGYIFNVVSRSGKVGFEGSGGYSASKFGMLGLSESLSRELAPFGIKVTALCPGWVNTQMAFDAGTPLPEEQMIQPEDLFKTIKFLLDLSPGASVKEMIIEPPLNIN